MHAPALEKFAAYVGVYVSSPFSCFLSLFLFPFSFLQEFLDLCLDLGGKELWRERWMWRCWLDVEVEELFWRCLTFSSSVLFQSMELSFLSGYPPVTSCCR